MKVAVTSSYHRLHHSSMRNIPGVVLFLILREGEALLFATGMCTDMVVKGYGGKVKLQDIMDIAVKMAMK